jgi:hypothetical protein
MSGLSALLALLHVRIVSIAGLAACQEHEILLL